MPNQNNYTPPCSERVLRNLYVTRMMTRKAIAELLGEDTARIRTAMRRYGIEARSSGVGRPYPTGSKHPGWKSDPTAYSTLHNRVRKARGTPSICEQCPTTEGLFDWANQTGNLADPNDYVRLCRSCHVKFDGQRRSRERPRIHCAECGEETLNTKPTKRFCSDRCREVDRWKRMKASGERRKSARGDATE